MKLVAFVEIANISNELSRCPKRISQGINDDLLIGIRKIFGPMGRFDLDSSRPDYCLIYKLETIGRITIIAGPKRYWIW